jgi:hypothetical protein
MRCGVVLFDSANNIASGDQTFVSLDAGWASISGAAAIRISSIHDLDSVVLWITNLTEEQFYRAKLTSHANFRSEGYLRSTLRHIANELGVDTHCVSADVVVSVLSTIAQRVVTYAQTHYGITPNGKALTDDFAIALRVPRSKIASGIHNLFEGSAQHAYVRTVHANAHLNHGTALTLRRNRLAHAKELLALPVPPDSHWEYISCDKLPSNKQNIESMLEQSNTAFLVRCNTRNINPSVADVFSVGSGAKVIREWLTDIEWQQAREWADIEYIGLLRCNAPSAPVPQADALPSDPYASLSFTCGLVAEQVWTAMTMRRKSNTDEPRYTAAAAWFRAMDRTVMFSYARNLHAKGLSVLEYGSGNVVVLYPDGGLRHALDVSTDNDLLAPASKLVEARNNAPMEAANVGR